MSDLGKINNGLSMRNGRCVEDFDSSIASVQIRPAQPRCNLAGGCIFLFVINGGGRT